MRLDETPAYLIDDLGGGVGRIRTSFRQGGTAASYAVPSPHHSARAAARLNLIFQSEDGAVPDGNGCWLRRVGDLDPVAHPCTDGIVD